MPSVRSLYRSLAVLVLFGASAACWVPIEQGQAMEADIVKLKAEVAKQRQQADETEARAERERIKLKAEQEAALQRVDQKVREVGEAIESLNRAARKTGADLGVEVEETRAEVARLRGLLEEAQVKHAAVELALTELRTATEARIAELEKGGGGAQPAVKAPLPKQALYDLAKSKLDAGESAEARTLFTEFLARHAKDPLAANAQYWVGESHYAEKRYREAIFSFQKVRDDFSKSDKAPDATLKMAFCFAALDLADDARLYLDEVVRTWPKSNAAKLAKDKLAELEKGAKKPAAKK